ncbi:MAG: dUTP diphosphatase [Clostridiales bacterium]|nr:dUTP diphosphatase [Clostridiales bacterium]MCF8022192.1 dUTP diphosphatase [Clostridiales bacterium]
MDNNELNLKSIKTENLKKFIELAELELKKRQGRGFEAASGFEKKVKYLPQRATPCSGGYDIWPLEEVTLYPGESHVFYTGIKVYMPEDEIFIINIRSSYGIKNDIQLCNEQGWIDADYYSNSENDGVIIVKVKNFGSEPFIFKKEESFAQGLFVKYYITDNDSPRMSKRSGGIGHSTKRE